MSKKKKKVIWVSTETDLLKLATLLKKGITNFEIHFSKEFPVTTKILKRLSEMLVDYAENNHTRIQLRIYQPDGSAIVKAVGVGFLGLAGGLILEGLMLGEIAGPVGGLLGLVAGAGVGAYMYLSDDIEITVQVHLPEGGPNLVLE